MRELDGSDLWAVVKANGYGHGAVDVAAAAFGSGASAVCVVTVAEGLELRHEFPAEKIVVLGPTEGRDVALAREAGLELVVASDERRDRHACRRPSVRAHDRPDPDRVLAAPHLDRADVVDLDPAHRQPVRSRADQDLTGVGNLLEPGRQVDSLTRRERRIAGAGDDLARLDPDPSLKLEVSDSVEDHERRAYRALGVVLVGGRNAEGSHHGISGELLDRPAVRLDVAGDPVEEPGHAPAHDFRVARGDERRRVDEVDEQNGCKLAFGHSRS